MSRDMSRDLKVVFAERDSQELVDLIGRWPRTAHCEPVVAAVTSPFLEVRLMALTMLAFSYNSNSPGLGVEICDAVEAVAMAAEDDPDAPGMASVVAFAAVTGAAARGRLGRWRDLIARAESVVQWLRLRGNDEKQCELHLWLAEAHLTLEEPAECEHHLVKAEKSALPPDAEGTRMRLRDLRRTYDAWAALRVTELSDEPTPTARMDVLTDDVETLARLASMLPGNAAPDLPAIVERLRSDLSVAVRDPLGERATALMEAMADHLGAADPDGPLGLRKRMWAVGRILQDPQKGHDPSTLAVLTDELTAMSSAAEAQQLSQDLTTIWWCLHLCLRRQGHLDAAAETLQRLRGRLEETRARISDPLERAGVLRQFPELFPSLAACLYETRRTRELLEAIEGAKGRSIIDTLEQNGSDVDTAQLQDGTLNDLPGALESAGAHYLTFLVDVGCTYAVLLAADGSMHSARVDLGRDTIRQYAQWVDPAKWGSRPGGFLSKEIPTDLPERLAPLVAWLEPLVESGLIAAGDHLCYCPDKDLHLIPLHFLPLCGAPLVRSLSVSRIHSARTLMHLLSKPSTRPARACVVEVPATGDEELATKFPIAGDWLLAEFPGERLSREDATLARVQNLELAGRLVHFTTHGTFPDHRNTDADRNPFRSSGMLLATSEGLPSKSAIAGATSSDGLLTPELTVALSLAGSHLTMQGCSTGLSRSGSGGDALGLEWALLLAGAASTLTAHWEVPVGPSAEFCMRFYDTWLIGGASRAQAWRSTVLKMMAFRCPMTDWSGFSLAGDWR